MRGSLEMICGCMFSGKTEELLRRIRRAEIAKQKIQIFKSHRDTRYSYHEIKSHTGLYARAIVIPSSPFDISRSSSSELGKLIDRTAQVIAIDEVQFFDEGIVQICEDLANDGYRVIVAGLTLDFRGEPFGNHILALLAKADVVDKLHAICVYCGEPATRTQRLIKGKPANWNDPIFIEGGEDIYQAVCRFHHQIKRPSPEEEDVKYEVFPSPSRYRK